LDAAASKEPADKEERNNISCKLVHNPDPEDKQSISLAEQATGFSADGEKVNMAAILSGMGVGLSKTEDEKIPTMKVAS
jgi:hypothetical protein